MPRTCPDCGKQVDEKARTCMNCGCNLRLRRVWTWGFRLTGILGVLAAVYGIIWAGVFLAVGGPMSDGEMTSAYFECHRRVSAELTPAGRIDFPPENYDNVSESLGEKTYRFVSYVTVRHDTRANRRYDYTCTLEYRGLDYWPLPGGDDPWKVRELTVTRRPMP